MDRALTLCPHNGALKSPPPGFLWYYHHFQPFPIELLSKALSEPYLGNLLRLNPTCSLALDVYVRVEWQL